MSGEVLTELAGVADEFGRAHLGVWGAAGEDELPVSTEDGVEKGHLLGETVVRLKVLRRDLSLMMADEREDPRADRMMAFIQRVENEHSQSTSCLLKQSPSWKSAERGCMRL
jgi:hypothetical protein